MSAEPYVGDVSLFAFNKSPKDWLPCDGKVLKISDYPVLAAVIGNAYGGDGQTTFALPNLNGRVPVGTGQGPGLPNIDQSEMAGEPSTTLVSGAMPMHNHSATAPAASSSTTATPSGSVAPGPASLGAGIANSFGTMDASLVAPTLGISGGSQPHNNMQPYLGMNYIICVEGIYPSRN